MDEILGNLRRLDQNFYSVERIKMEYYEMLLSETLKNLEQLKTTKSRHSQFISSVINSLEKRKVDKDSFENYQKQCREISNEIGATVSFLEK